MVATWNNFYIRIARDYLCDGVLSVQWHWGTLCPRQQWSNIFALFEHASEHEVSDS
jgi:hypothetical protein